MRKKKIMALILTFILCISSVSLVSAGTLGTEKRGLVIDVIDGEAIVMKFSNTNVFIRLIGVNTLASQEAYSYMIKNVKGKYASVITENFNAGEVADSTFIPAYVYMYDTGEFLNERLIRDGVAEIKVSHSLASKYEILEAAQIFAKSKKIGIWSTSGQRYTANYDATNINTASARQLRALSSKITTTLASAISTYSKNNPFNTIEEIKFVPGMTKEIFDEIREKIVVSTNVNEATEDALLTLKNMTSARVDKILDAREIRGEFLTLEQLYTVAGLAISIFEENKDFISLEDKESIDVTINEYIVNINTASATQIGNATEGAISGTNIVKYRQNGYYYNSLMELTKINAITIKDLSINKVEDNLHVYTDLNNASTYELRSLFGSNYDSSEVNLLQSARPYEDISEIRSIIGVTKYESIKDFIYVDNYPEVERFNLNLATQTQLEGLGLTSSEVIKLSNKYKKMSDASYLPFNISDLKGKVTLYTNINLASEKELALISGMDTSLIAAIINYRAEEPFGSATEVETFFKAQNRVSLYESIKDFIVVR